ncbi:MAG TPA: sigma-70 family RNA polymerase sigma factor [Pyrinomonadaceae bacterium]|nr:sigma-70 family RNA polymerase sigma factor [Pyrinomonadaceae bacterium]
MLDQRRVATQPDEKRERLFTERYESLLAWALRLTNYQRDAAEDLVQDAFVQFVLGRTKLEEIENIDGYLRRMLRYMHVSRINRSAQHLHESALSVADYDSCRLGWSAIETPRRVQASEELHQICAYACSRKESSRAGSVLILRFFHEYFPTEIAAVLNSSRHSVDELQRFARREAKLFMDEPGRLRFVNKMGSERQQFKYLKSEGDLMLGLRQMIFDSCKGECISRQELEQAYSKDDGDALTTPKLAHIVSCPYCLDAVNSLLGLPLLSDRYETGRSDFREPPGDANGGGASGGGSGNLPTKFGKRLREIHEHKPQELRISVNSFLVSSLTVSSDLNEVNLNLTQDDPIEFVEVCSEQGVPLLFFTVDPVGPDSEQWAWIELSEGRFLEASFYNENGPSLRVIYKDPLPEEAFNTGEMSNANALSSPLFIVPEPARASLQRGNFSLQSWTTWLAGLVRRRVVAEENTTPSNDAFVRSIDDGFRESSFLTLMGQSTNRNQWGRFSLFVALASAALIGGFLFFKASLPPPLTATTLLESATVAEQVKQQIPDKVRHRSIRLEERRSAEGAMVAQRRIEIWENRASGNRAQRLYDDSNRLIAGAWEKSDGSRIVYQHGSKPQSQPKLATPDNLLFNLEDVWQLDPSPQTFRALIGEPGLADVEERSTTYVITYERVRTIGASRLLKATLTLTKSDLHPIEQTLLVQRGDESREYRFGEANDELLPAKAAAFEIEPELIGGAREPGRTGDWALRDLTTSRVPPTLSTSTPPAASAELEVDVAYLLNLAKADRNEQVALTRSAGGSLRVEGVVDTQQRKEEFLRTLAPVSNNPAVVIDIRTVADATAGRTAAGPLTVQETEETANTVAADEELRAYFTKKDPGGPTDETIRSYSSRVVNRAYSALFHAIELKKLISRFANVDMRTVAPDARAKWLSMLRQHASAFARENELLRQEIQPIFFPGSGLQVAEEFSIQSDGDLARAVERLHRVALSNNDAIRSAFLISSHSSAAAVKSAAFWLSLQRAENLAERVMEYQTSSN